MNNTKITEHQCDKVCSINNDEDTHLSIRKIHDAWVFHKIIFACEKCVSDGQAQYEGELISVFDVSIIFCPYCGAHLNERLSIKTDETLENVDVNSHLCIKLKEYNQNYPNVGFAPDTKAKWKITKDFEHWYLERYSISANGAENGELEFWNGTGVNYCPFCGLKLKD
jgi:hypothetical protein